MQQSSWETPKAKKPSIRAVFWLWLLHDHIYEQCRPTLALDFLLKCAIIEQVKPGRN